MGSTGEIQPREGGALIGVGDVLANTVTTVTRPDTEGEHHTKGRAADEGFNGGGLMDPIVAQTREYERYQNTPTRRRMTAEDLDRR